MGAGGSRWTRTASPYGYWWWAIGLFLYYPKPPRRHQPLAILLNRNPQTSALVWRDCFSVCINIASSLETSLVNSNIRLYEVEGKSGQPVNIIPAVKLADARRTNLIEEDAGNLEHDQERATLKVGPFSIETVKLTPDF